MSESVAAQPDATQNQPQPASENTEQSNNEEPKIGLSEQEKKRMGIEKC